MAFGVRLSWKNSSTSKLLTISEIPTSTIRAVLVFAHKQCNYASGTLTLKVGAPKPNYT